MKRYLYSLLTLLIIAMALPFASRAQEKMYLVKGNRLVATYDVDKVDYITFNLDPSVLTYDFEIELYDITYTTAEWIVSPADADMYYYTAIYTPKLFEELGGTAEGLAQKLANDMKVLASWAQMDFETFMETSVLEQGDRKVGYDQMAPDSDYYIVAFGCEPDGTPTTDITKIAIHTPAIPSTGLTVEFNVDVVGSDAIITSTPSDPAISYFMQIDPVSDNPLDPQARINQLIWRGVFLDKTAEEVVAENLTTGTQTTKFSLDPNTDYVVYAVSLTPDGVVNSDISQATFRTGEVLVSNNTFEVELTDIVSTVVTAKITPSNNEDMYSIAVIPVADFEGKTDKEVMEEYQANWTNKAATDWFRGYGERTLDWEGLTADTEYYFCVFGYYQEVITTDLTKIKFKTPEPSDPKLWTCEFKDFHIEYGRWAMITIDVNEQDVPYVWNVVDSEATVEQLKAYYESEYARVADKGMSIADYVESRSVSGTKEVSFSGMEEGETYKYFAVVLNPETGDFDTEVFFSEPFTKEGMVNGVAPMKKAKSDRLPELLIKYEE